MLKSSSDQTILQISKITTYSNLATASVAIGDKVKIGQIIGRVDDSGQLEFVCSDEKSKIYGPEKWLKRY